MRHIYKIDYEDKEFEPIEEAKRLHGGNWHYFILDLARDYLNKLKGGDK